MGAFAHVQDIGAVRIVVHGLQHEQLTTGAFQNPNFGND